MSRILSIDEAWRERRTLGGVTPPREARVAARRGLDAASSASLSFATRRRAQAIADGDPHTLDMLSRIVDHHATLEKAGERDEVAHLLHGGNAGRAWAEAELAKASADADDAPEPPDAHRELRRRIGLLLAAHGDEGTPLEALRGHVARHGSKAVARALRDLGHDHRDGRIVKVTRGAPAPVPAPKKKAAIKKAAIEAPDVVKAIDHGTPPAWRPFRFRGVQRP